MATGHQRSDGRVKQAPYLAARSKKLEEQKPAIVEPAGVLRGVRVYIDGYISNTTDIEMKRFVTLAGGEALCVRIVLFCGGLLSTGPPDIRRPVRPIF